MVLDEAGRGDPDAAERRLAALNDFAVLEPTSVAAELVDVLIKDGALPSVARDETTNTLCLRSSRIPLPGNLHTRRTDGRYDR